MNFLKSILSDEPDPNIPRESDPNSSQIGNNPNEDDDGWSFGGMFKTLAMQSETVIEIYRRDLEEFGLGLRRETELFRETASRAVKDLPASIEAAHGALDGVLKSTVGIVSKESVGVSPDGESGRNWGPGSGSGRYSRFEAQVSAIRNDLDTFCVEPEDGEDYGKWKLGFELEDYRDEIERLIGGNGILEGVYRKVVVKNGGVDGETFWCRYFYRVEKLKQRESVRANLVRRAISVDDELSSWDFDDDDDGGDEGGDESGKGGDGSGGNGGNVGNDGNSKTNGSDGGKSSVVESSKNGSVDVSKGGDGNGGNGGNGGNVENDGNSKTNGSDGGKSNVVESSKNGSMDVSKGGDGNGGNGGNVGNDGNSKTNASDGEKRNVVESSKNGSVDVTKEGSFRTDGEDEKVMVGEKGKSDGKSDGKMVSSHESEAAVEEDLSWDEIEDTGSGGGERISAVDHGGSPRKDDHRKLPLNGDDDDDDEDLNWGIEDDDDDDLVKA